MPHPIGYRRTVAVALAMEYHRMGDERGAAAKRAGCHVTSLRRALQSEGIAPLSVGRPRGINSRKTREDIP